MILLLWLSGLGLVLVAPYALLLGLFGLSTFRQRDDKSPVVSQDSAVSFAFIVPAHDEAGTIEKTLSSLQSVDYPKEYHLIVVIADNCSDQTALVAREMGVRVFERQHATRRSKGFALEDTLPKILADDLLLHVDAFVIVDADTVVDKNVLHTLAPLVSEGSDWIQGLDLVANPEESWRTKLLALGFALFNGSFQVGSEALGLGAHLRGNGMSLSRKGLQQIAWTSNGLAEDLEFSWKLRLAGEHVRFASHAKFYADMPVNPTVSANQRRRWEKGRHGLWRTMRSQLWDTRVSIYNKILWALDLSMPSLTVVAGVILISMLLLVTAGIIGITIPLWLIILTSILAGAMAIYGVSPFLSFGLPWSVLTAVLMLPYYAIWRLLITLGRIPTTWVRTERRF
ncbi:MAG: glycosyltransferase family 2 protein [Proteobacteria bacterium]|nr:glycosyltransferase family 2 protein [Pseudomonadota bacterium]